MIYVSTLGATFGLLIENATVIEAPPIARWAAGRPARTVWDYYIRKGATVAWLP